MWWISHINSSPLWTSSEVRPNSHLQVAYLAQITIRVEQRTGLRGFWLELVQGMEGKHRMWWPQQGTQAPHTAL